MITVILQYLVRKLALYQIYKNYPPQGFRISKNIGHSILGSGGKKTFKWYLKSEQTDKHTDKHTDTQTDGQIDL